MLFAATDSVNVAPGVVLFRGAVESAAEALLSEIGQIVAVSPLRHVMTPMGKPMSVEMTNCGLVGWVSDRMGYRYESIDPITNQPWPIMPALFADTATEFASLAGYRDFVPDVCLINRYSPGSKMGLHQDRDETDFSQPIVSMSVGLPITFKIGGQRRTDPTVSTELQHGDVLVFGGPARLAFHGVGKLSAGLHPSCGFTRWNLTFRRARE
jgi:alkylated DNA repair protein (DNA oxidative demethylase)